MGVLTQQHIERVHHYAPLHYLPFIGRSKSLLCKPSLLAAGFAQDHLRSMSREHDVERGFGAYTHLTLEPRPRILKAKLAAGFPHIGVAVPADCVEAVSFSLCRFNVAMTRHLRRNGQPGFPESSTNGRYYDQHQIPIARSDADKTAMLEKHLPANTMIEVLVHGDLVLPDRTEIGCFSDADAKIAQQVLSEVGAPWNVTSIASPGPYPRNAKHVEAITTFIDQALAELDWRGNGLEFDRL
ncbi:MAG: hypothetical protein E6G76_11210 [Alphaproteobacteria bacterium]|nr:MAG: hypothetical protein E6G76_11210 [Alphaproteobacteria bacterium]